MSRVDVVSAKGVFAVDCKSEAAENAECSNEDFA